MPSFRGWWTMRSGLRRGEVECGQSVGMVRPRGVAWPDFLYPQHFTKPLRRTPHV
jgi:hypothetical protein